MYKIERKTIIDYDYETIKEDVRYVCKFRTLRDAKHYLQAMTKNVRNGSTGQMISSKTAEIYEEEIVNGKRYSTNRFYKIVKVEN